MTNKFKEIYVWFCIDCGTVIALVKKIHDIENYVRFCNTCNAVTSHYPVAIDFDKRQYVTIKKD